MSLHHAAYAAVAAILAVATTALVAWAGPTAAPEAMPIASGVESAKPATPAALLPIATPADAVVAGSARAVLDRVGLAGGTKVDGTVPRPCGKPFAGWFVADAARGVDGKRSMTVTVAAWRAGLGPARFSDLIAATRQCASTDRSSGEDTFWAMTAPAPGERTMSATRLGDVIAVIETATVSDGSAALAQQGLAAARRVLTPRLVGTCVDPSSGGGGDFDDRDPYGEQYSGRKVRIDLALPISSPLSMQEVSILKSQRGEATWSPPRARDFPELAPLDLLAIGKSQPLDADVDSSPSANPGPNLTGLPRLRAPRFVDPTAPLPPTDERPDKDPGPAPVAPSPVADVARTDVPTADPDGPGCGWAFTGVRPAVTDPVALAAAARSSAIIALATQAQRQADWLAAMAAWPEQYRAWEARRRAANNWRTFETVKKQAQADFEEARREYLESVRRWQAGDYPKPKPSRPGAASSPSASPTSSSTPTPGATPDGSPTGGAGP